MPDNFLVGCATKYKCNRTLCYPATGTAGEGESNHGLCGPMDGYTLAPWVKIRFIGEGGREITVGNLSSPDNENLACIKDFEFGGTDGIQVTCTVHDQRGGSFAKFMEDLITDSKCLNPAGIRMEFQWGWVRTGCGSDFPPIPSDKHYAIPDAVECNFSGGKFMFTITATDMGTRMFEGRTKEVFGSDDNPMCLVDAIQELFTEACGPVCSSVRFRNKDMTDGICWEKNECPPLCEGGSIKGPKGKWEAKSRDKLQICNEWLAKAGKTINDRSCRLMYDSTVPGGQIVVQEDTKPKPNEARPWDDLCIGTYIVNGGFRSPVIEFNPRIRWHFGGLQAATGGEMGTNRAGGMNDNGGQSPGDERSVTLIEPYIECIGTEISAAPDENADNREMENAEADVNDAETLHEKALHLIHDVIEADLIIVGDPTLPKPLDLNHLRSCSIVFINPYHLVTKDQFNSVVESQGESVDPVRVRTENTCGEWLAEPTCNEILSNKAWIIKQVNHKISPGSYTTTLRVYLTAPGENIECFEPLGGTGSQGWRPKCCD